MSEKTEHVHNLLPEKVPQGLELYDILWHSFLHMYHLDCANAPIHTASVRYSPLTFRIAEYLYNHFPSYHGRIELLNVVADIRSYEEDPGR